MHRYAVQYSREGIYFNKYSAKPIIIIFHTILHISLKLIAIISLSLKFGYFLLHDAKFQGLRKTCGKKMACLALNLLIIKEQLISYN